MFVEQRAANRPLFSLCIPQYERTSFLLELLRSLSQQRFRAFEVCISDGASPQARHREILHFLKQNHLPHAYQVQDARTSYDANLRAAVRLAQGHFCILMGNDDALRGPGALERLTEGLSKHGPAGVIITDYEDYATGRRAHRIRQTRNYGHGARVAASHFRNFSFVSGVVLAREPAQHFATDRWDGSEMYQTFLGCRMIASGIHLLELEDVLIRKDIIIPGEAVDRYSTAPRIAACPIIQRQLPLSKLGRVVADGIQPYVRKPLRQTIFLRILLQLVVFTYPFWILEYRRIQSWRFAIGICLGMRPQIIAQDMGLDTARTLVLSMVYGIMTVGGLLVPLKAFKLAQQQLYWLAKRVG